MKTRTLAWLTASTLTLATPLASLGGAGGVSADLAEGRVDIVTSVSADKKSMAMAGITAPGDPSTWAARVYGFNLKDGQQTWFWEIDNAGVDAFTSVAVAKKIAVVVGVVTAPGDPGTNLVVQGHSTKDGALLWEKIYENQVDPAEGIFFFVGTNQSDTVNPSVLIAGKRAIVTFISSTGFSSTIVLDTKTGQEIF